MPKRTEIWDPVAVWPAGRRWVWAGLALIVSLTQGPGFVASLRPGPTESVDFFQEWASARSFLEGEPVYTDLEVSAVRYLGRQGKPGEGVMVRKNVHPPASVLLAIPFGLLDYPNATLAWNLLSLAAFGGSLWLMGRALAIRPEPWVLFPAIALMLICNPLRQQVNQGQFNLVLLLLLTGVWSAERSGRMGLAGTLLGLATAFKLFPGFLFFYFLLRRRWSVVIFGTIAFALCAAVSLAILGPETYASYLRDVFPGMSTYRTWWSNASLPGFWFKWFDSGAISTISHPNLPSYLPPLTARPGLARLGLTLSAVLVMVLWARVVLRARSQSQIDHAFGLTLITMFLISPITWDHYFLLLCLPIAQLWMALSTLPKARLGMLVLLGCIWINPIDFWLALMPLPRSAGGPASLVWSLSVVSFQCFALLGLFWLGLRVAEERSREGVQGRVRVREGSEATPLA